MGILSRNLMLEEYPLSEKCFMQEDSGHWIFETEVASFLGIGRFVLGLFSDIEIIGSDDFIEYVKNAVNSMKLWFLCALLLRFVIFFLYYAVKVPLFTIMFCLFDKNNLTLHLETIVAVYLKGLKVYRFG